DGASDYSNAANSVTILAGATSATITIPTSDDGLVEDSETVSMSLVGVSGDPDITLSDSTLASGTIDDNDSATVSLSRTATVTAGGDLTFTVTLSAPSSTDTTLNYSFGGTATDGSDYTKTTISVTIPAGETSATVTVPTTIDNLVEGSETVSMTLDSITG